MGHRLGNGYRHTRRNLGCREKRHRRGNSPSRRCSFLYFRPFFLPGHFMHAPFFRRVEAPAFRRVREHDTDDHAFFRPCGGNIGGCHAPSADVHDGGGRKGIHHDRTGERAAHAFYHEKTCTAQCSCPRHYDAGHFLRRYLGRIRHH